MDEGKKTTVYLPAELAESLRLLAFQMYTTVSDLLAVAAEEKYRRCIAEGSGAPFGPQEPSEEWRAIHAAMTDRRIGRLFERKAERRAAKEAAAQLNDAMEADALGPPAETPAG